MLRPCHICKEPARYSLIAKAGRLPDGETGYSMQLFACRDHFDEVYAHLEQELSRLEPRIFVDRLDKE